MSELRCLFPIVTLLVHLITLIFTIKSTVMTQKMQVIQPEMNRITKKYEGKTDERPPDGAGPQGNAAVIQRQRHQSVRAIISSFHFSCRSSWLFTCRFSVLKSVVNGTMWGLSLKETPLHGVMSGQWLYLVLFVFMAICQIGSMMLPRS